MWTTVTSLTKQRMKLNMKLLGQFGSQSGSVNMKEDKPTYREQFVPPEMSMISYFLSKVILSLVIFRIYLFQIYSFGYKTLS